MLDRFLPKTVYDSISRNLDLSKLTEIRLRSQRPVIVEYGGYYYLSPLGITDDSTKAIVCDSGSLNDLVFKACECSIYSHNEQLKQGFITVSGGCRVGVCGELVTDKGEAKTMKNFSSVNVRFPHQIKNCSLNALRFIADEDGIKNTLIISPPGGGKTTFIRDLAYQLSDKHLCRNVLVVDERNEIAAVVNGVPQLNVGEYTDIISGSSKMFGLESGIRTMKPDVIVLDELANIQDALAVEFCIGAGVRLIATAHAKNLNELKRKAALKNLLDGSVFDRFVVLSEREGAGTLEGIFDQNYNCLYCG
ncbi:MAG: stage III sporulation protein AA [Firmicutes bacterium]|nr:stage III sporulation protein AA [Bacillota bacterium]